MHFDCDVAGEAQGCVNPVILALGANDCPFASGEETAADMRGCVYEDFRPGFNVQAYRFA